MAAEPSRSRRTALRRVPGVGEGSGVDKLIHERRRLAVVSALAGNDVRTVVEL
jgi:hypothetical protein